MGGCVRDGSYICVMIAKIERQLIRVIYEGIEWARVHAP